MLERVRKKVDHGPYLSPPRFCTVPRAWGAARTDSAMMETTL